MSESARGNKDVKRAAELAAQWMDAFPDSRTYWAWALLRAVQPDRAGPLAESLAGDEVDRLEREIRLRLCPVATNTAFGEYWSRLARGQPNARAPLDRLVELGVPLPKDLLAPGDQRP